MLDLIPSLILGAADPHKHLAGVHPDLVTKVQEICLAMAAINCPLVVTYGVRTSAEQAALYAQGRQTAGPNVTALKPLGDIVTEDDGVVKLSKHQVQADGFGHAVDCAFLVNGIPSWFAGEPWAIYGAIAMRLGLHWGGTWTTPHDLPHVELP